jgi:hypothetical protein
VIVNSPAATDLITSCAAAIESCRKPAVAVSINTRTGVPPEIGDGEVEGDGDADGSVAQAPVVSTRIATSGRVLFVIQRAGCSHLPRKHENTK